MATQLNQPNGIHLNVRPGSGLATAGHHWLQVPADGVPADLLPRVEKYLAIRDCDSRDYYGSGLMVDAPTWESVRAAVEREMAEAAEWKARAEVDAAERARAEAAQVALVREYLTTVPAGKWEYTGSTQEQISVPKVGVLWPWNVPADLEASVREEHDRRVVERKAREDAEETRREAAKQAILDERDAWIRAHGSPRLRKGLDAGLVDQMRGVYRDERIAHDLGAGWIAWKDAPESEIEELLNPDEAHLDALAEAQARFPASADARLRSVGLPDEDGGETTWKPALALDCPWDAKTTAIKYLPVEPWHM